MVVADLTMPDVDGWEVMALVRQLRPGLPFVMMSGLTEAHTVLEGNGQAPEAFLQKPFTMARLAEVLSMAASLARRNQPFS
jgi:CheY-like chemotaxis protein